MGKSHVFLKGVDFFYSPIQQSLLMAECGDARLGHAQQDVLDHRAHASRNLKVAGPVVADLGERQLHEIRPVRCPEEDPELSISIEYAFVMEVPIADRAQ